MKKNIILMLFLSVASTVMAQTLTLNQCREMALEHNKSLKSAQVKSEQMNSDVQSYKANFFPRIDIMAAEAYSWGKNDFQLPVSAMASSIMPQLVPGLVQSGILNMQQAGALSQMSLPDPTLEFKIKNVFVANASVTQPLYMGGKIVTAYQMSKIGKEMAETNVRLAESQVIVNTDEAYMMAVKAKQLAEVARSYRALLDELQKNVDAAVSCGMKMRNDALKVQVKRNEVELKIKKADNACRLAIMNLCQVIGMDMDSRINVEETSLGSVSLSDMDAEQLSNIGIESRPEYSILQNKTALASKNVKIAMSDYLPQIALVGGYVYLNGMELEGKKLFDSGSPHVAVTLKVPVLEYFTQGRHKIRSARAAQQIAVLEQEELNEKMSLELTRCANNLSESALEVEITHKSTEQAEENMKMSRHQYEVGTEPLSDYLEAQALWQQAWANEIEAKYQYYLANSQYLKAIGKLK